MNDKKTKKPLKRIELKKHSKDKQLRFRASRTGGLAGSYHPVRGVTFSSRYGLRASKTLRGLTLGFQGKRLVFRGRWSAFNGLFNLNLSKSGLTFSSKSRHGTYNFSRPNSSSFKFAGIQIRGKKAAGPALIFTLFTLFFSFISAIPSLLKFVVAIIVLIAQIFFLLCDLIVRIIFILWNLVLWLLIDVPFQILVAMRHDNETFDAEEGEQEYGDDLSNHLVQDELPIRTETNSQKLELAGKTRTSDLPWKIAALVSKICGASALLLGLSLLLIAYDLAQKTESSPTTVFWAGVSAGGLFLLGYLLLFFLPRRLRATKIQVSNL